MFLHNVHIFRRTFICFLSPGKYRTGAILSLFNIQLVFFSALLIISLDPFLYEICSLLDFRELLFRSRLTFAAEPSVILFHRENSSRGRVDVLIVS